MYAVLKAFSRWWLHGVITAVQCYSVSSGFYLVLYCTVLSYHCTVLSCIALYCTALLAGLSTCRYHGFLGSIPGSCRHNEKNFPPLGF